MAIEGGARRAGVVGYLMDYFRGYHQEIVWREVNSGMRDAGLSMITFVGQAFLRGHRGETDIPATNNIYHPASTSWIRSYFLSGENLGFDISKEEFSEYMRPFRKRPCISIGPCGDDIPAVVVEGRSGIKDIVEHLVSRHGRKRIAYISGVEASIDAQERLAAYKEGLAACGLPFLPELVFVGDFWFTGGQNGVRTFIDERRLSFDAVISANDFMSLGALRELKRRGIRVPQEVSVAGFDDVLEAEHEHPPLTTVRWPLREQASAAVKAMLGVLDGGVASRRTSLSAFVVPRRSCGCQPLSLELAEKVQDNGASGTGQLSAVEIVSEIASTSTFSSRAGKEPRALVEKALSCVATGDFSPFHEAAETAIYEGMQSEDQPESWQNLLSVLRANIIPRLTSAAATRSFEGATGKLRIRIGNLEANRLRLEQTRAATFNDNMGAVLKGIAGAPDLPTLGTLLRDRMKGIELRSFYFATKAQISAGCGAAMDKGGEFILYSALCDGSDLLDRKGPRPFVWSSFLPEEVLPRRVFQLIALPVTFGNDFYGIAAYEPGPADTGVYLRINDQIGTTVHDILLMEAEKHAEDEIRAKTERIVSLARPISESVLEVSGVVNSEAATVETTSEAARKMRQDLMDTQLEIGRMAESALKIRGHTAVIEDISSTISLLGLNAAIEAAHVGQAGRGFNVIATEIRKLAESSRQNAENISASLAELSSETERSVVSVKRSSDAFSALDAELERVLSALKSISGKMSVLSNSSQELIGSMEKVED